MTPAESGAGPATWVRMLSTHQQRAARALFAAVRSADGVGPDAEHDFRPEDEYLLAGGDADLRAVGWLPDGHPAELLVAPDARGRGLGRAMLGQLQRRSPAVWAHGDLPAAQALAADTGLRPVRTLLQMRRSLPIEEPPAAQLPDGVRIRTFMPGQDEDQFLAVNGRAFAWHPEQSQLDRRALDAQMQHAWFDAAGFFLAVRGDRVLGFHWTKVHAVDPTPRGDGGAIGEIYVLGVDPGAGVRGLGLPLALAGLDHLARRQLDRVMLYTEADNAAAVRLYERLGFAVHQRDVVYQRP